MKKCLEVPRETPEFLKQEQIEAHMLPTAEAVHLYNELAEKNAALAEMIRALKRKGVGVRKQDRQEDPRGSSAAEKARTCSNIRDSRFRLRHTRSLATGKVFSAAARRSRRVWQTAQCARIEARGRGEKPYQ
jgi:aldehyde:ferredoxin oxidoreductase